MKRNLSILGNVPLHEPLSQTSLTTENTNMA